MATSQQDRHLKGVREGGRFKVSTKQSVDADLDSMTGADVPTGSDFDPDDFQAIFDHYRDEINDVDPTEMLRVADLSARKRTPEYLNESLEDIKGDALAAYFNARRNAQIRLVKEHLDADGTITIDGKERRSLNKTPVSPSGSLANPAGYLNNVTDGIVQRYSTGSEQSSDRKAVKQYLESEKHMQNQLGREITESESQALSDEIRLSMPKGRRPVKDFHRMKTMVQAVSTQPDSEGRQVWDDWTDSPENDHANTITSTGQVGGASEDQVESLQSNLDNASKKMQKARVYDALASELNAPTVNQFACSASGAKRFRSLIHNVGGPRKAIAAWRNETLTDKEEAALFAPFGSPGYEDQCAIVDVLENHPSHTDDLWEGALTRSTRTATPPHGGGTFKAA